MIILLFREILIRPLHEQYSRLSPEVTYEAFKSGIEDVPLSHDDLAAIIKEGYKISIHYKDNQEYYTLTYINVNEFQSNGRLHSHFAIFGLDYLINIHDKDHRNKDPRDCLKAYLLKAQYATSVNYWVFNSRYYANSRNFEPVEERE